MRFRIIGDIANVETIATGSGIREIARLRKRYGRGRWRKRKGTAEIELPGCDVNEGLKERFFGATEGDEGRPLGVG